MSAAGRFDLTARGRDGGAGDALFMLAAFVALAWWAAVRWAFAPAREPKES